MLGALTRGQLYGSRYVRVFPDVFAPAELTLDLAVRSRAAYLLVEPRCGVLAGYSAAALLGADCAPRNACAEVLVARYARAHPGLRVRIGTAAGGEVTVARGCRVTTPIRTAWDLARRLPLVEAVVAVDALARAGTFAPTDLLERRAREPGARASRRLDTIVALADPRAESPPETRLRVAIVRAGLPRPEVQVRIDDEYGFPLARVDLAYPAAKLAIEYDGAIHFNRRRSDRDRERDTVLAGYGWETLRLVADDLEALPTTVQRIARLLALRTR